MENNVALYREELGLSQEALAKRIGRTQAAISKIEQGLVNPHSSTKAALARVFGTSVRELFPRRALVAMAS